MWGDAGGEDISWDAMRDVWGQTIFFTVLLITNVHHGNETTFATVENGFDNLACSLVVTVRVMVYGAIPLRPLHPGLARGELCTWFRSLTTLPVSFGPLRFAFKDSATRSIHPSVQVELRADVSSLQRQSSTWKHKFNSLILSLRLWLKRISKLSSNFRPHNSR